MLIERIKMTEVTSTAKTEHTHQGVKTPCGTPKGGVGDRLHFQICNHARCAANNPDYAIKAATPLKKFLVAKKHAYGGLENKGNKASKRPPACDQQGQPDHALHSLTNAVLQPKSDKGTRPSTLGKGHNSEEDLASANSEKRGTLAKGRAASHATSGRSSLHSSARSSITDSSAVLRDRPQQRSRRSSLSSPYAADQDAQWEDSTSSKSCVTAGATLSPTASVGSNQDEQLSELQDDNAGVDSPESPQDVQSPASESASANVEKSRRNEGLISSPSVISGSNISGSPTQSVASNTSRLSPSPASITSQRSPLAPHQSAVATRLARKFITNLKENSKVGSSVPSAVGSAKKLTRISKPSTSPSPLDSSSPLSIPSSGAASRLARKFISDLQASSAARKGASTKGVRSIELRGGRAQTYSTTTVTSVINVTTTTVETSVTSTSANSFEKITDCELSMSNNDSGQSKSIVNAESGLSTYGSTSNLNTDVGLSKLNSGTNSTKPPWNSSTKDAALSIVASPKRTTGAAAVTTKILPKEDGANGVKIVKKSAKITILEEEPKESSETVSLKHGEVAERRLSEEWMTNHALENIRDKDHRVKVLVNAFESLAGSLSDCESHTHDDNSPKASKLGNLVDYEALSGAHMVA